LKSLSSQQSQRVQDRLYLGSRFTVTLDKDLDCKLLYLFPLTVLKYEWEYENE
jgi:hypothetical protein